MTSSKSAEKSGSDEKKPAAPTIRYIVDTRVRFDIPIPEGQDPKTYAWSMAQRICQQLSKKQIKVEMAGPPPTA